MNRKSGGPPACVGSVRRGLRRPVRAWPEKGLPVDGGVGARISQEDPERSASASQWAPDACSAPGGTHCPARSQQQATAGAATDAEVDRAGGDSKPVITSTAST